MTKRYFKMVVFISTLLFLVSCAAQEVKAPEPACKPVDLNPLLRSGEYLQRVAQLPGCAGCLGHHESG